MKLLMVIVRRELASYLNAALTYLFLSAFVALAGILTFYPGDFYARNQADLDPFFTTHPWETSPASPASLSQSGVSPGWHCC